MSKRSKFIKSIIKIAQVAGFTAVPLLMIAAVVFIPEYQINRIDQDAMTALERARQVNEFRKTILQVVGGIVIAIGLYFTWRRIRSMEETTRIANMNARITEQGHITDRFSKAIEQLGDGNIAVRLGGIFALERIAKDSEDDHWTVMEVLSAFVRNYKPEGLEEMIKEKKESEATEEESPKKKLPKAPADVQAAVTVIGRRDVEKDKDDARIDLTGSYLVGVNLNSAHLEGAELSEANLEGAELSEANLEGAELSEANLKGANLNEAHLERAFLVSTHLERAFLVSAHLEGANLSEAHLERAFLVSAHLEGAYLVSAHLEGALLNSAHLERADLSKAHLEGAELSEANLKGAFLDEANLEHAFLVSAHLEGANLSVVNLKGAFLDEANLTDVKGINLDQLKSVNSLYKTKGISAEWVAQLKKEKPCLFTEDGCE